jgi:cell division septation protein DedD
LPGASATPNAAAAPNAAASPAASSADQGASGEFEIAVAAFRTESRAAEVVSALRELQLPAEVRADGGGVWQRVIAGPFRTRDAAQTAQETLTRAGYADTRISSIP